MIHGRIASRPSPGTGKIIPGKITPDDYALLDDGFSSPASETKGKSTRFMGKNGSISSHFGWKSVGFGRTG
jgi:hypothetical protein